MTVAEKINAWREEHPNGTQVECIADNVASPSSVYRHWPTDDPKRSRKGTARQRKEQTVETESRTERYTVLLTPERKKQLKYLCVDDDITASDWIDRAIATAWDKRKV